MELTKTIRKYALQNAIKFSGKANPGNVIPKIMGEQPELKSQAKELAMQVQSIVKDVNAMSVEAQISELQQTAPELLEEKPKEKKSDLKELDNVDLKKGVVMRFAPSPSGPMHIGHAITGGITSAYIKKYNGRFILRIEDTNADNIDPDAYHMLPEDGEWLFGNVTEVWIQSDRMQIYYDYVTQFIEKHAVYVCTCSQENFKKHADNQEDCPCRNATIEQTKQLWQKMFDKVSGFKEGEAVLRFKTSMQDKNPAMRDFPLARINDTPHPKQGDKYRVWPLMNLAVTVDDIEAGMTHIIRAKDHADNAKRQEMMFKVLGKTYPQAYFTGRYNFEGLEISCSKTKAKIKEGAYSGWDDIRVPFMRALKRRGYQPGSFLKYTMMTGLSPVDKTVPADEFYKTLNALNKEIIDPVSDRYFMIKNPVEITVNNAPEQTVELDLHPATKKGGRNFNTHQKFLIEYDDHAKFKDGALIRLMDCINFTFSNGTYTFHSLDYETYKTQGKQIIHWLVNEPNQLCAIKIVMPDASSFTASAEIGVSKLSVGAIVQFERFGFCRLDHVENGTPIFWFAHK